MAADGRFGGHVVQGHVDTVTEVVAVVDQSDGSRRLTFRLPDDLAGQIVEKGSVTLDGASLTVASVDPSSEAERTSARDRSSGEALAPSGGWTDSASEEERSTSSAGLLNQALLSRRSTMRRPGGTCWPRCRAEAVP